MNVLEQTTPTPATSAAIALYRDVARRGAACHLLGNAALVHFEQQLWPRIYAAYTQQYGMTAHQAQAYLREETDGDNTDLGFGVLDDPTPHAGWDGVELAVRDCFTAMSLHLDGMLHAATGELVYWNGR